MSSINSLRLLLFVCYFYLVIYSIRVSISIRIISVITVHVQYGNIQADGQVSHVSPSD